MAIQHRARAEEMMSSRHEPTHYDWMNMSLYEVASLAEELIKVHYRQINIAPGILISNLEQMIIYLKRKYPWKRGT